MFIKYQTSLTLPLLYPLILSNDGLLGALGSVIRSIGWLVSAHNPFCFFHNLIISFLVLDVLFRYLVLLCLTANAAHLDNVVLRRPEYNSRCLIEKHAKHFDPNPSLPLLSFVKSQRDLADSTDLQK